MERTHISADEMDERDVEDDTGRDGAHEPVGDDGSLLARRVAERDGQPNPYAHEVEPEAEKGRCQIRSTPGLVRKIRTEQRRERGRAGPSWPCEGGA